MIPQSISDLHSFLVCLKINYPFFIRNSANRLVSRSVGRCAFTFTSPYMILLNNICSLLLLLFFNRYGLSIWRMNRLNLLQTLLVGASDLPFSLFFCLRKSVCTANAINFNRILSWSCIHVRGMFYLYFFFSSQMQNSHIQIFVWQTMELVNHSIHREKTTFLWKWWPAKSATFA